MHAVEGASNHRTIAQPSKAVGSRTLTEKKLTLPRRDSHPDTLRRERLLLEPGIGGQNALNTAFNIGRARRRTTSMCMSYKQSRLHATESTIQVQGQGVRGAGMEHTLRYTRPSPCTGATQNVPERVAIMHDIGTRVLEKMVIQQHLDCFTGRMGLSMERLKLRERGGGGGGGGGGASASRHAQLLGWCVPCQTWR